jgi:protein-S-isoprenylcysteine O-methyltransferase Ste14
MKDKRALPPTYLLIAIVLMLVLHFPLPVYKVVPVPWNIFGIVPLACGIVLNLIADSDFHHAQTTVKPFEQSTALITTGVFRITRNPMYLGYVLILVGVALIVRSLTPYAVIVVFAILMDRMLIRVEEQMLESQFVEAWLKYGKRVRRWV